MVMLGHKIKESGKIAVVKELAPDLPTIPAHPAELNQVWTNLIDNAIDAVDGGGGITLRAYVEGARVVVEVVDDGPGIPREAQGHVFEPFYTTKEVGAGTGLGLDIVRRIVTGHGGEVFVRSEPGETRFTVRLPLDTTKDGG
jgi:signal transduction histidine kinase